MLIPESAIAIFGYNSLPLTGKRSQSKHRWQNHLSLGHFVPWSSSRSSKT
ncbi:hypothetical protein H6F74_28415 [Trichocoleus sp. FACHB-90]|nr:hypothetical protein [Trichocoleus sp. FACHB-90]MBD1930114.1 hypothetical protein [Trichocoleus sp. FACHB-90]